MRCSEINGCSFNVILYTVAAHLERVIYNSCQ